MRICRNACKNKKIRKTEKTKNRVLGSKLQQNWPRIHVGRSGASASIVSPRSRPKKPSFNLLKTQITFPTIFLKPSSTPKTHLLNPQSIPDYVPSHFPSFISKFARESPSKQRFPKTTKKSHAPRSRGTRVGGLLKDLPHRQLLETP